MGGKTKINKLKKRKKAIFQHALDSHHSLINLIRNNETSDAGSQHRYGRVGASICSHPYTPPPHAHSNTKRQLCSTHLDSLDGRINGRGDPLIELRVRN